MQEYGASDLVGAWIISQLWQGKPQWAIRVEMASMVTPVDMEQHVFENGRKILSTVGLVDQKLLLTPLGREAVVYPTPGVPSYCERFRSAFSQMSPLTIADVDVAKIKSAIISDFTDLIYLAEASRRRLA